MSTLHLVLYAPSSVQKLLDFLKTVYTGNFTPVIVKPMGAAAQVGIPEAHKISYKLNKPLIVLPEISDLVNVLGCDCIYYISDEGEEIDPVDLVSGGSCGKIAIMLSSGELEPSRRELEKAKIAWIKGVPRGMPSVAIAGIIVYELLKLKR
ncbi:MAG: RecB-family nuclease [Desulfurococcaceae archaeon]